MFILPTDNASKASHNVQPKSRPIPKSSYVNSPQMDTASTAFALPTDLHILDGFVDSGNDLQMRQIYRDLYYHDPICGTCVDIYSLLPFGDFSLSGIPDKEMLNKFLEMTETLRVKTLFPTMTIDQLVEGAITGAVMFNDKKKIFDTYLPLNLDFVELFTNPIHGGDPLMDIKVSDEAKRIFKDKSDPRVKKIIDTLPDVLKDLFTKGTKLKLQTENGVYIPRTSRLSHKAEGISLFRRVVPIWLIEKALARGTIESAYRRQRGIMWVQMGDMDWIASPAEMQQMGSDVVMADRDPLGAVLVTRPGVQFSEIRDAQSLWKHSDVVDIYNPLKFKALGFSESLMSGELSIGSADSVMSVFNRQMRAHRDNMVRAFMYEKIFPYTSMANDFEKDDKFMETSSAHLDGPDGDLATLQELSNYNGKRVFKRRNGQYYAVADGQLRNLDGKDPSKYYNPTVNWHDSLRPEVQSEYLDTLDKLEQKGVPVPLRTLIAASGMSVGDIVASMDEDVELRKVMFDHMKKIKKFLPAPPEGNMDQTSLLDTVQDLMSTASAERRNVLDRGADFEGLDDSYARNVNNGPVSLRGKKLINERANKAIAGASVLMAERENSKTRDLGRKGRAVTSRK